MEKEQIVVWPLEMLKIPSRLMSLYIILVQKQKEFTYHTVVNTDQVENGRITLKMRQLLDQEGEKNHSCTSYGKCDGSDFCEY